VLGITTLIRVTCEILALTLLRKKQFNFKLLFLLAPLFVLPQSIAYFFGAPLFTMFLVVIPSGAASGFLIYINNKYIAKIVRRKNITVATYATVMVQNLFYAIYLFLGGVAMDFMPINYVYLFTGIMLIFAEIFILVFVKKSQFDK
jgi:hypothetical protein